MLKASPVLLFLCVSAMAQTPTVLEIPAMTVPNSAIDMDAVGPAGPTTEALVNATGTNCGASLREIRLTPSAAAQGGYNTQPQGRALARDTASNNLILVDPPSGVFGAFDAQIYFAIDCTEFGIAVGDWVGPLIMDFFNDGAPVVSNFTTATFGTVPKFFQMTGGTFDQVNMRASTTAGNWVIPDLITQIPSTGFTPYGRGCNGSGGEPKLAEGAGSSQRIGQTMVATVSNTPPGVGGGAMIIGTQARQFVTGVNLPFSLGLIGAPSCLVWTNLAVLIPVTYSGGGFNFAVGIPNQPSLVNSSVYLQAVVGDAGAPGLITVSNAARICIQP
jgi:hypothetical protein